MLLVATFAACGERVGSEPKVAANPFVAHALPAEQRSWREGSVVERVATGPYVYLRLRAPDGSLGWVVSLRATTPADDHVRAFVVGRADHFHSQRLDRDFDPLAFAAVRAAVTP